MDYLAKNLRFLRKRQGTTQEEMAANLDLKKSTYASYENDEGNTPPAKTLFAIAKQFNVSMESLFEVDYTILGNQDTLKISAREIYFPVSVDLTGTELIDVVPANHRAQAGYLNDFSDPSYIRSLPKINWDLGTYESGSKRIFQIAGDSMLPIPSQSFILGIKKSYEEIVNNQAYIVVTDHDILFKRIQKDSETLLLISDNSLYPPQSVKADEVQQYWKAIKVIMDMPTKPAVSVIDIHETLQDTNEKVNQVLNRLNTISAEPMR
ncbi:MAG: LexA family transcriptional regulator [Saprospiraceae bacterium]|nr:LexA family transcriptional regulator [Saprospiraceae bacterium]